MAEVLKSGVGATFSISAAEPDTYDSTGFAALTYLEVGEVISIGAYGGTSEVLTQTPVKSGIIKKVKGSTNYGSQTLQFGLETDTGQAALQSGFDGANKNEIHSVKLAYSDGSIRYYTGLVTSFEFQEISASSFVNAASTIEVNNSVVDVVPA